MERALENLHRQGTTMNCSFDTCRCGSYDAIEHRSKKRPDKFAILSYLRTVDFKYLRIPIP